MILNHYEPRPELKHFIRKITVAYYRADSSRPNPINPFPPQPDHSLYFYPYDKMICRNYANNQVQDLPRSMLIGAQLSRFDLTMSSNMLVILVHFHPGGMHRLIHIPIGEIGGEPIDSALILGKEIETVTEQLSEAASFHEMIEIIELYLLKKTKILKESLPLEQVLAEMFRYKSYISIDQLAKKVCVSTRQLERQFKERVGMPPKIFFRLVRFSNAWIMREKNQSISWLKIANACNYADQMHMIRDFKDFAGVTPGTLQRDLEKTPLRLQGPTFD
jgi:AraC-like DNA-binding protein